MLAITLIVASGIAVITEKNLLGSHDYFHAIFFIILFYIGILGITEIGMKPLFKLYDKEKAGGNGE